MTKALRAFALLLCALPFAALAQMPPDVVRGTVEALNGNKLTLRTESGVTDTIVLAPDWTVTVLKPIGADAIKPGSLIGTAEMPLSKGVGRSLEVHVFPPGMRPPVGHFAWNLRPGSMMTNGTVGRVAAVTNGREMTVVYPHGSRRIVVPRQVPIVEFTRGERSQIKPGLPAILMVSRSPQGALTSGDISIGADGAKPPM